jgi:type IV secretion system protein TrbL
LLVTAGVASAQTSPSAMLDQFRAMRLNWLTVASGYANRLFGILALIEFAWTAAILVMEKTDLQGWTAALIRKMMFIGAFFALLNFGADWIPRIINSFQIIGQTASGLPSLAPTDVLVKGLNIAGNLLAGAASSGWMGNFGTAMALVFASLLSFLAFLGLTVQLVVTLVESYLVVGAGFIFLGFGGSRWTAPYVERYIALAVSTGVKVMVLYLLLGAGLTLTNGWAAAASAVPLSGEPAIDALDIAASAVLLLMICWNAPKFTAAILGGSPAFTGGDAVGTAGALAQGALLAGAAVAGGMTLGSRVLASRAGAMSASHAAGMGAGGNGGTPPPPAAPGGTGGAGPKPPSNGGGSGGSKIAPPAKATNGTPGNDQVPPPGAKATKGLLMSAGVLRAAQGSIPSDVAPPATPPALDIRSEGGD